MSCGNVTQWPFNAKVPFDKCIDGTKFAHLQIRSFSAMLNLSSLWGLSNRGIFFPFESIWKDPSCSICTVHVKVWIHYFIGDTKGNNKWLGQYPGHLPVLLHTSVSGLIRYMFESLKDQMGDGKDRDLIDRQHILISNLITRQSEHDFPWGSMRNGLIDGTKCQSSEQKGNLFQLLCIAHTANGSRVMKSSLKYSDAKWKQWYIKF